MDPSGHIEALRLEGGRAAAVMQDLAPDASVPACPEWAARDLIGHMGTVQRWAGGYVAEGRTEFRPEDFGEAAATVPGDDELASWYADGCAALVATLEEAPADLQCWTFVPSLSALPFWARRQAHETAIHRVDIEQAAAGPGAGAAGAAGVTPFTPAFAADGIDELLTLFVPLGSRRANAPATLGIECADDDAAWVVTLGPDAVATSAGAGAVDAACTLRGGASDLYLALWGRRGTERLRVEGDRGVFDLFCDAEGALNLSP